MATPFDTRQFVNESRDAASASDPVTAARAVVREAVRALASGVVALAAARFDLRPPQPATCCSVTIGPCSRTTR